jgi:3-oxosteroid 1-dehydrogenase
MHWDHEYDMVVVGTGGGALTAAIPRRHALKTLIVEKDVDLGRHDGIFRRRGADPANPLSVQQGVDDSIDDALRYLESVKQVFTDRKGMPRTGVAH